MDILTIPTDSNVISAAQRMWRYMTFSRFIWLLERKQLWLARADQLGDLWEMALAGDQLHRVIDRHPPPTLPLQAGLIETAMERARRVIGKWRKTTFVNCWCASDHESHALWRVYCGATEGVALETNFGKLAASLHGPKLLPVSYENPGSNIRTPTLDDLVTKKRPMFNYEHEIRIVHTVQGMDDVPGLPIDWSPEEHLVGIRVHPEADASFMETVVAAVANYAPVLKDQVVWSEMRARPPV